MSQASDTVDIIVPRSGLGDADCEISRWKKTVGDSVSQGEVVVEVEADKSEIEIEIEDSGVLTEILAGDGSVVEPGQVIGRIEVG